MSDNYFREIYENTNTAYQMLNEEGKISKVNNNWLDFTGFHEKDIIGKWFGDFLSESSRKGFEATYATMASKGIINNVTLEIKKKDGSYINGQFEGRSIYDHDGNFHGTHCLFFLVDKTGLACKPKHVIPYYTYFNESVMMMNVYDAETKIVIDVNKAVCEFYKFEYKNIVGKTIYEFTSFSKDIVDSLTDEIVRGECKYLEASHIMPDGELRYVGVYPSCIYIDNRPYVFSSFVDITNKLKQEIELKELAKKLETRNRITREFALGMNEEALGRIINILVEVFDCEFGLLGYISDDILHIPTVKFNDQTLKVPKDQWEGLMQSTLLGNKTTFDNESPCVPIGHYEISNALAAPINYKGDVKGLAILANRQDDFCTGDCNNLDEICSYMSPILKHWLESQQFKKEIVSYSEKLKEINTDLEEKVRIETAKQIKNEQIIFEQKKFADMGQMINAIAHQWRQPLNSLGLAVQFIEDKISEVDLFTPEEMDVFGNSFDTVKFMSNTIDDFRNFFAIKKAVNRFDVVNELIKVIQILGPQLNAHDIKYELFVEDEGQNINCTPDLYTSENILADKIILNGFSGEYKQVIINLVSNAKDAIIDNVNCGNIDHGNIVFNISMQEDYVRITICDNGGGIPERHKGRIFDPYFTTKEEGKGTGIGLYMSKAVIENNFKGTLNFENIEGGVCFSLLLPKEV